MDVHQPRSGSICNRTVVKSCGGDGWERGIVASGLRPCGGGMCVIGTMAGCEGPSNGRCAATVGGIDEDACNAADMNTDDDTARAICESAASFVAAGRTSANCSSDCTYIEATGSCPDDTPPDETVGYIAFDVGTNGGGTLQAYDIFRTGP